MQASEEQGVTPWQQQGPGATAGRGQARGEAHGKGAGEKVGEDSLDMHFPKLFIVISTSARYSRQTFTLKQYRHHQVIFFFQNQVTKPKVSILSLTNSYS